VTIGALNRNESRGAHFKPDFPERDDANFQKTTMASFKGLNLTADKPFGSVKESGSPEFKYEPVDVSLIKSRARKYDVDKKGKTA
jgi:succinate dehydrogenase / fumarate reductase flavoprotein subunit